MNCTTTLCVSRCGRNLGEFDGSEKELPLPSLPAEGAASDFVLGDYFLTNSLFQPLIPSITSICPHAGIIIPPICTLVLPCR